MISIFIFIILWGRRRRKRCSSCSFAAPKSHHQCHLSPIKFPVFYVLLMRHSFLLPLISPVKSLSISISIFMYISISLSVSMCLCFDYSWRVPDLGIYVSLIGINLNWIVHCCSLSFFVCDLLHRFQNFWVDEFSFVLMR